MIGISVDHSPPIYKSAICNQQSLIILDGIQSGNLHSLIGRAETCYHTNGDRKQHGHHKKPPRNHRNASHIVAAHNRFADILNAESTQRRHIDAYRTNRGNQASDHTADKADRTSLAQEHHANIAHIAAKSLHNADFARTFRHRHNHGVGNTNRGNEERHRADAAQSQLDAPRLLFDLLTRLLKRGSLITGALDLRFNVGNVFDVLGVHQ